MTTPLVELDGDEMTCVLWRKIKAELIEPHVDLRTEYYDLGLLEREATKDQVTVDAARAIARYGVGVSAPRSRQTPSAWRNTTSAGCGKVPTGRCALCSTERYFAHPSW